MYFLLLFFIWIISFLSFFNIIVFYVTWHFVCISDHVCALASACRGQRRTLDPLELGDRRLRAAM